MLVFFGGGFVVCLRHAGVHIYARSACESVWEGFGTRNATSRAFIDTSMSFTQVGFLGPVHQLHCAAVGRLDLFRSLP